MENNMKWKCNILIGILQATVLFSFSQEEQPLLRKGNQLYKQKEFDKSLPEFQKAVAINPENPVAQYNFGNVLYRKENYSEAEAAYSKAVERATENTCKKNALYNKGVS